MAWSRGLQARVVQIPHRTNVGGVWRSPSRAPWQRPPAIAVTAARFTGGAALHRPLGLPQPVQLRRQRPSAVLQILQVAVAVERPAVDPAGPTAPVAGLRGARTGVVGLGPARAAAALAEPRAGRDGDLPRSACLPAAHEVSPPWPGCKAPTSPPSRRARPSRSRIAVPPYSAGGQPRRAWSGCGGEPKAQRPAHPRRGALDRPALSCPVRVGLARPTKQVVDGSLRDVLAAGRRPNGGPRGNLEQHP
jgi:hypothetical protein